MLKKLYDFINRQNKAFYKSKYHYHTDLLTLYASNAKMAAVSANIIVPLIYVYVMSDFIDKSILVVWLLISFASAFIRIVSAKKLSKANRQKDIQKALKYAYFTISISALMWASAIFLAYLYAPPLYVLFTAIIIISISAGAITTMSMIYHAYFIFVTISIVPMLVIFAISKEKVFIVLSFLVIFFVAYILTGGYRYYNKLREAFILKDKLKLLNNDLENQVKKRTKELEVANTTLEKRVEEELEKNRKKDQQLFQQSRQAQMGEMISMIAHQWRQPLGAISSTSLDMKMKLMFGHFDLSEAEQRDKCNEYFDEQLSKVESYVESLTTTIDDFRNFYKPNKAKEKSDINKPIKKALNIIGEAAKAKGVDIKENYESSKELEIYSGELMQVFLNLIKNAQDNFIEKKIEKPKIDISTKDTDNGVEVAIYDNGGGISEDIIEKIFDPYFSTKSEKNGTGLGLYMTKTIVEEHHKGKIEAINTDDGVMFKISIFETKN